MHLSYPISLLCQMSNHPIQKIYCSILEHVGPKWGKTLAMNCIGTVWTLIFVGHFMIWKLFHLMIMLNLVNMITNTLTFVYFLEASYKSSDFDKWSNGPSRRFLYTTILYWEVILAGIVFISLII